MRTWVGQYTKQLQLSKEYQKEMRVDKLESKKKGRPPLLGNKLDKQVQLYVEELSARKVPINTAIVMSAAEGVVKNHDSNLLLCNGGHIECGKHWAKNFLVHMGYTKRQVNIKYKISIADFEAQKAQFVFDVQAIMEMEEIPQKLVINWDHTGINYVPVSNWTMAKKESKRVEIVGLGDKRQITAVFGCTMSGDFLPPQIIYAGKHQGVCLPLVFLAAGMSHSHQTTGPTR